MGHPPGTLNRPARGPEGAGCAVAETTCADAIFQQPWWLDAVAPGRWGQSVVERGGRTVARLPYAVRGRGRWRMLTQPPLTPTLGPWVERSDAKPAHALSDEIELLAALEAALPPAHAFRQQFTPGLLNALPFFWAGYRLEVRYTYRIAGLHAEDKLWDDLRPSIRGRIRKAHRHVEVRDDLGLDLFYDVYAKTYARQGLPPPHPFARLERLDAACRARGASATLFAQDEAGRVHSVVYVVGDAHATYHLLEGSDPQLRASGAAILLRWEAIKRARSKSDVFDFEGSMLKPLERVCRNFGARQTPYLVVSRATPHGRAALALRATQQRLSAALRRPGQW